MLGLYFFGSIDESPKTVSKCVPVVIDDNCETACGNLRIVFGPTTINGFRKGLNI